MNNNTMNDDTKNADVRNDEETREKKYDIGVVGVWYSNNYGSIATNYGLNRVLQGLGYSVLMIEKNKVENDGELSMTPARKFAKEHYDISPYYSLEEFEKLNQLCDIFMVGSDQIWNWAVSRLVGKSYYLDFAADNKKKIAYGSSWGHANDWTPVKERPTIIELFKRFSGISVREDEAVIKARERYRVMAKHVLDPVFLVDRGLYDALAEKSRYQENEPYILTYILDPTPEKREALIHVSKKMGLKLINLLDGLPWLFDENKGKLGLDAVADVQIEEWLYYIKNSEFMITDSFHGAAFATLYQKTFIPIVNKGRGEVRLTSYAKMIGVSKRLVYNPLKIIDNPLCLEPMDYGKIQRTIQDKREESMNWLKHILETPKELLPFVALPENAVLTKLNQKDCAGCSACVNKCPTGAMFFCEDEWGYYRSEIAYEKCINCGMCSKVCPALKLPKNDNTDTPACFALTAEKEDVLSGSSSGGVFSLLAGEAFKKKGSVSGAAWKTDFSVEHIIIDNQDELYKLQKSKYLQSYLGSVFVKILEKLRRGEFVLFTGCPCQVAGLKGYVGKEYENLVLVDLLCGNAPSTLFFQKYIADSFPQGIDKYEFRYKGQGWNAEIVKATTKEGNTIVRRGAKEDDYQRVYHNHTMCAPHCEDCKYQQVPRFGDLTIGDFWGIGGRDSTIPTEQGVSVILCNNEKGRRFFDAIPAEKIKLKKEVPLEWLGGNGYAIKDARNYCSPGRDLFYQAIQSMSFGEAVDYALKPHQGSYNRLYQSTRMPLQFDSNYIHFTFDHDVWEEHNIKGKTTLMVKDGMYHKLGRYARLPLYKPLMKGKEYLFSVRFKLKSESNILSFHIKDSGSKLIQIIYSYHIPADSNGTRWVTLAEKFVPDSHVYDEFMVGASQVKGMNNYLTFDYINISQCEMTLTTIDGE